MLTGVTPAREIAAHVLVRVDKDRAFASAALDAEIARRPKLDPRDRALATELVYGTLRVHTWLMARLGAHAKRGLARLDAAVRAELALGAYQLFFTRVPPFAAVSEAVDAVRRQRGKELGAFANAVLRKVAEEAASRPASHEEAVLASCPAWLRKALDESLGPDGARLFLASAAEPPALGLRVERARERDAWLTKLRAAHPHASFEAGRISPHAILARGAGKFDSLTGFGEGAWAVEEEGAQVVALAVGARPGDEVLDACAGRGNKTGLLARAVAPGGAVDAADVHPAKLERMERELARLGLAARGAYAVDWTVGGGAVTALYDRVLVDAPCSGTGTLGRRPELGLRLTTASIAELARVQLAVLCRVADRVRPGGRLLYAVCSVLREEGEGVVDAFLASHADFERAPFDGDLVRRIAGESPTVRLLPTEHGTDGYFLASLRRAKPPDS
jgi:16S rRNA (cytosine967-C5)-methyltransferase